MAVAHVRPSSYQVATAYQEAAAMQEVTVCAHSAEVLECSRYSTVRLQVKRVLHGSCRDCALLRSAGVHVSSTLHGPGWQDTTSCSSVVLTADAGPDHVT
jgi:hypothetical protein